MSLVAATLIVLLCLWGSFFFSGIEMGLLSFNRVQLRALVRRKSRRALIVARFLERPERFLATSLVGNTIVNTIAATLVGHVLLRWNPHWGGWIAFGIMTYVLYVVCELVPKSLFRQYPTRLTVAMADLVNLIYTGLLPIVWIFSWITSALLRVFGESKPRERIFVSREEIKRMLLDSEAGGQVTPEERRMIQEVFNLHHVTLQEVMTPMNQATTVPADGTAEEIVKVSRETGCSRLPALDAGGAIAGVVSVYDILFDAEPIAAKTARPYLRRACTFPGETPIDEALQRLRATQQPLAVVLDKSQRPIGIATIEDLLAKLIGEIEG